MRVRLARLFSQIAEIQFFGEVLKQLQRFASVLREDQLLRAGYYFGLEVDAKAFRPVPDPIRRSKGMVKHLGAENRREFLRACLKSQLSAAGRVF